MLQSGGIIYLNIQSLLPHVTDLQILVNQVMPDVLLLSEARVTDQIFDSEINITGYNLIRCDSNSRHTGGVVIYVKKYINYEVLSCESDFVGQNYFLAINIRYKQYNGLYGVVYHSPSTSDSMFLNSYDKWCEDNFLIDRTNTVCGDFNINMKNVNNSATKTLNNIIQFYGCKQIVTEYTHISCNYKTLIDLVITNDFDLNVNVLVNNNISDHETLGLYNNNYSDTNSDDSISILSWKKYSQHELIRKLSYKINWTGLRNADVNSSAFILNTALIESVSELTEQKQIKVKDNQMWYTSELKHLKTELVSSNIVAKISGNILDWTYYKSVRNSYVKQLNDAKCNFVQNGIELCRSDPKKMWKKLKDILKQKTNTVNTIDFDGELISDSNVIANRFNEYFITSINEIHKSIDSVSAPIYYSQVSVNNILKFKPITFDVLFSALKSIETFSGVDNINIKVIKDSFELISVPLINIFNESLKKGIFPNCWKNSTIVPVPKIARSNKCSDFRPINQLPLPEKLLEIVVKEQLMEYINSNDILIHQQSGFRKNHSCETALNLVVADWTTKLEDKKKIVAVFIDLKRAFETIDRKILLEKLHSFGVRAAELNWFKDYLNNRTQETQFNDNKSRREINELGVPQGSVLGPLLFNLYINDISTVINKCSVHLFADDTMITASGDNIHEIINVINEDLSNFSTWLKYNKLKLNVEKTKFMIIGHNTEIHDDVKIDDTKIEEVAEFKYLGVILDDKLSFKSNINFVIKKIAKKVGFLGRLSKKLSSWSILTVFKTIIAPHIDYCSTMLFMNNDTDLKRLQLLQNRAMRLILKCNRRTHIDDMLKTLNFQSVKQRIYFNTLLMIYKIKNKLLPAYLSNIVVYNSEIYDRCLRRRSHFRLPAFKKSGHQQSVFFKGLDLFNKLPDEVRRSRNIFDFKKKCNKYVKENF